MPLGPILLSALFALKSTKNLGDVAKLINFRPSALSYIIYKAPAGAKYTAFEIPKRSGGTRKIFAPTVRLKLVQRRLAALLQDCAQEISDANDWKDSIAHGFKRGRSIVTNASCHRRRRFVFNIDIENFFGAINFGRVRNYFIKNWYFSLHPDVATVLAQIACHEDALPQGSPCSPVISNLIGSILDAHMVRLAARTGCRYTRYADDLSFSTNLRTFPPSVAFLAPGSPHKWMPGEELSAVVDLCRFKLNPAKTRMQYRDSRQEVTGLVVNKKVNVRAEYRHTVRAMVDRLVRTGKYMHRGPVPGPSGTIAAGMVDGSRDTLKGMLGFIDSVDRYNEPSGPENNRKRDSKRLPSKERSYRRFLLFTEFYAASRPLIVCEGKTDYVYLLHAVRSLATAYPKLATIDPPGRVRLVPRLFRYRKTGAGRVLGLGGGAGGLRNLIVHYREESDRFTAPGLQHPAIVLMDNDDGAKEVLSLARQITGSTATGLEQFIFLFKNMYLVLTPKVASADKSCIEDAFTPATRASIVNGKSFSLESKMDTSKYYGKSVFAREVVAANADKIDFAGFQPLLDRLVMVLDVHGAKISGSAGSATSVV